MFLNAALDAGNWIAIGAILGPMTIGYIAQLLVNRSSRAKYEATQAEREKTLFRRLEAIEQGQAQLSAMCQELRVEQTKITSDCRHSNELLRGTITNLENQIRSINESARSSLIQASRDAQRSEMRELAERLATIEKGATP